MNRFFPVLLLLCAVLPLAAPPQTGRAAPMRAAAPADTQAPIAFVSGLGGRLKDGAVDGSTAYLIEGAHLTVLDIGDPAAPRLRARAALPGLGHRVVAANGYVYLMNSIHPSTTWVYDARDPAAPRLVGQLPLPDNVYPYHIQIAGGGLWFVEMAGVRRYDLSNPAAPALTSTFACTSCHIQVAGALAYLLHWTAGLQVWDLSNPYAPLLRAQIAPAPPDSGSVSYTGLALDGDTLYTALTTLSVGESTQSYVATLDVSDPSRPTAVATGAAALGELSVVDGRLVTLIGNELRLYSMAEPAQPSLALSQTLDMISYQVAGHRLYGLRGNTWSLFDLSGASGAVLRTQISATMTSVSDVTLEGQRLYAHLPDAIQIIDVTNPLSPTLQARIPLEDPAQKPDIDGTRLLVPASDGLRLIDASDPLSPTVRAVLPQGRAGRLQGNLAYVLTAAGLDVLDISDLANPVLLGSAAFPMTAAYLYDMFVASGRAYIGFTSLTGCPPSCRFPDYLLAVQVVDVANPQQPKTGGRISDLPVGVGGGSRPNRWAVSGTTLFVANAKLYIIDVSNIDSPRLSDARYDGDAEDVQIAGGRAYVAGSAGLTVLDLADPLHPAALSRFSLGPTGASQVQIADGQAYLLSDGLRVLDIRNPSTPLPQASYGSYAVDMAVAGPYVYLAMGEGGLQIVQLRPEHFPQPLLLPLVRKS